MTYSGRWLVGGFCHRHEISKLGAFYANSKTIINGRPYFHVEVEVAPSGKPAVISPLFFSESSAEAFAETLATAVERLRG